MTNETEFDLVGKKIIDLLEDCSLSINECHLVLIGLLASMQRLSSANIEEFWSLVKKQGIKFSTENFAGGKYDG